MQLRKVEEEANKMRADTSKTMNKLRQSCAQDQRVNKGRLERLVTKMKNRPKGGPDDDPLPEDDPHDPCTPSKDEAQDHMLQQLQVTLATARSELESAKSASQIW